MAFISPTYEVLYDDLNNHHIGSYLMSREFKIFMSERGTYDLWKTQFDQVKHNRTYFALGFDHGPSDASDTFALFLNEAQSNTKIATLVTSIIEQFILFKKEKTDFKGIIQSMRVSKFSKNNIEKISHAIELHNQKTFSNQEPRKVTPKLNEPKDNFNNKVFVVHGQNDAIRESVARVLEKLGLDAIILTEKPNSGKTIIEKFEKHSDVGFAIILLTADDEGYSKKNSTKRNRARQNVILELGYFIGKLGRGRIAPIYEEDVELPSDLHGITYIAYNQSNSWRFELIRELKEAGYKVDANKIL